MLISMEGKEILIWLVAQAIQNYTMSLFKLPKVFVSRYIDCIEIFGGVIIGLKRNDIGHFRTGFRSPGTTKVFSFGILSSLTRLFLRSMCGG